MNKKPAGNNPENPVSDVEFERRRSLGAFFRSHRLENKMSEEEVAEALELASTDIVLGYETGRIAMPLEDVFSMTNLLNVPPEDVMDLIHKLYTLGAN